jgi:acyl homoserine lactone synthase
MDWPLFHADSMEFEQYDTLTSVYIIAHEGDKVIGGARMVRTDQNQSFGKIIYSYMIRDAYLKNLPGLPSEICAEEPPVDPKVWELTRFTSLDNMWVGRSILERCNKFLQEENASKCLFLGPPAFLRMARTMGYNPKALGKITGNKDGRFLAFSCDVI